MHIKSEAYIEKASKLKEGEVEFVVSTNALDAHGERIDVDGIDLKDFKKNPVVLWGHNGFDLPIATAKKVWKEGRKLMARAEFYLDDEFSAKVYDYIVKGRLRAVSIGGMVQEWGSDGMTISKMLMKEFSVVTVPANQEALVSSKGFEPLQDDEKNELEALAKGYARKLVTEPTKLDKDIEILESLVATLKEVASSETQEKQADNITKRVILRQVQAVDKHAEKIIVHLKGQNNE